MNRNKILRHLYAVSDTNQPIQNCLQFCMNLRYFHSKCTKKIRDWYEIEGSNSSHYCNFS